MIVLSGVLVLLSIILLLVGLLFSEGLGWVYFSIGTSIAAGVFLVLGALQRRGETVQGAAATAPATDGYERVTAVTVTRPDEPAMSGGTAAVAAAASGGMVAVVPGRPRYHVESCRFLAGRSDVTQLPVDDARAEGYSACGVCKPDDAVAAVAQPEPAPEPFEEAEEPFEEAAEEVAATPRKRAATASKAPAKRAPTKAPAATAAPAVKAPAVKAPAAKATAAKTTTAAKKTAAAASEAPAKAAASSVVVIPDRGKFHVDSCRFVRDVPGTVTLSKASAKRQGYVPCGVCKP